MSWLGTAIWQGGALGVSLAALGALTYLAWLLMTWDRRPRWEEAHRHARRPRIALEHWIYFRWIHRDAQFWVVHVNFDRGPLVVEGLPPACVYWNLTWYRWTESNPARSSLTAPLDADGRFRLVVGPDEDADIPVRPGTGKGLLYLRVYDPAPGRPVRLPGIRQGDRSLVEACER